ncbi:MAG: hypothetical protein WD069_07500 [Planctomycetales bacterium]
MSAETTSPSAPRPEADQSDPVYLHSRREARVIFGLWAACLAWTVTYCYLHGFAGHVEASDLETVWGVPSWVFWGIAVPWLLADAFTIWFCFCYMQDDDLGEAHEGRDVAEEVAAMHAHDRDAAEGRR